MLDGDSGQVVRFETRSQVQLEAEEATRNVRKMMLARNEYSAWQGSMLDRTDPIFNTLTMEEQTEYNKEFLLSDYAALRECDPDAFRAYLSEDKTIEEIKSGYSPTLGNFTMDDWFESMGDDWGLWMEYGRFENNAIYSFDPLQYVYEQAELRGLL